MVERAREATKKAMMRKRRRRKRKRKSQKIPSQSSRRVSRRANSCVGHGGVMCSANTAHSREKALANSQLHSDCLKTAQCAPLKHHYDECAERVQQQIDNEGGAKEDCVEECKCSHDLQNPSLIARLCTPVPEINANAMKSSI